MDSSIQQSVQIFLNYLRFEKRYSENTLISYQTDLRDFQDFLELQFGPTTLTQINHQYIRSWLASLKEEGLSAKTIIRKISSLRSFFKHQLKNELIPHSPMGNIITPKAGKRLPVFIKEDETRDLLKSMEGSTENWKTLNAKMLVLLFYNTGMRLSELINLKEKQLDPGRKQIKVLGKGNKERSIPVSAAVLEAIKDYQQWKKQEFGNQQDQKEHYFLVTEKGKKMYPKYAYLLVNKYLEFAGTLDKKSPHVLRHTFATHLMNGGADLNAVKELLGHSSLASTQVYTHNTIEKLKEVHRKAHPRS